MRKIIAGLPIAALAMVVVLAATGEPAFSHYTYVYQGSDFMSISSSHTVVTVCDRENDGHAVYGDVINELGKRFRVYDTYNSTCTSYGPDLVTIFDFRLCEDVPGTDVCTGWKFS